MRMDTQRLILFVIFSMSLVFLWQAWERDRNPPPPVPAKTAANGAPAAKPGDVPAAPAVPAAATAVPPPVPGAAPAVAPAGASAPFTVKTDRFAVDIDPAGGVITRVALEQHRDSDDMSKPYLAMLKTGERTYIAQSGLLGEGLPNHRSAWEVLPGPRELAPGADSLDVKLKATAANGDTVIQTLTFRRGSYVIDVSYDITNATAAPQAPYAYFQLTRDSKAVGLQSSFAPVAYTGAVVYNETDKYKKVDFGEIDKLAADPSRKAPFTGKQDNGWIGMVEHYFVAAGCRARRSRRASSTRQARQRPVFRRRHHAGGNIEPGQTGRIACRCTWVRRTRTRSPSSPRASTSPSTTASSPCSRRRCSGCCSGCTASSATGAGLSWR